MRRTLAAILLSLLSVPAALAQDWGNLDALIISQLTDGATPEMAQFMPDTADPATATRALAIAYVHIPGSAGSVSIDVGLFQRAGQGWSMTRRVDGLFGMGPENPAFGPGWVEITTSTLGPDDPRCCPSVKTRWRIEMATGQAFRLN